MDRKYKISFFISISDSSTLIKEMSNRSSWASTETISCPQPVHLVTFHDHNRMVIRPSSSMIDSLHNNQRSTRFKTFKSCFNIFSSVIIILLGLSWISFIDKPEKTAIFDGLMWALVSYSIFFIISQILYYKLIK